MVINDRLALETTHRLWTEYIFGASIDLYDSIRTWLDRRLTWSVNLNSSSRDRRIVNYQVAFGRPVHRRPELLDRIEPQLALDVDQVPIRYSRCVRCWRSQRFESQSL